MGLFDYPSPVFAWLDAAMGIAVPPTPRLVLWGVLAGLLSMWLYRLISPQQRIVRAREELAEARLELAEYDGEFSGAWPLMAHLLRVAGAQVGRTAWPAIVASLPLLCLLLWLSTAYGYRFPEPGDVPALTVTPPDLQATWVPEADGRVPGVALSDARGNAITVPLSSPVPVLQHHRWWNALIANPAGYLPHGTAAREVDIALPQRVYMPVGPGWMRGWELPFFLSLVLTSLLVKRLAHIA